MRRGKILPHHERRSVRAGESGQRFGQRFQDRWIVRAGMAFTLAQLRLVAAIHEHGSLGKACAVLNLTQPALSRNLRELERHLGVELFERHPSGLRATQFCHAILPYAANMLRDAAQVLEEVRILAGESRRSLRIGTVSTATMTRGLATVPLPRVHVVTLCREVPFEGTR
jgi:DNA-binding MarR family transcriptional regulator